MSTATTQLLNSFLFSFRPSPLPSSLLHQGTAAHAFLTRADLPSELQSQAKKLWALLKINATTPDRYVYEKHALFP
jgi:hypothetical protein